MYTYSLSSYGVCFRGIKLRRDDRSSYGISTTSERVVQFNRCFLNKVKSESCRQSHNFQRTIQIPQNDN